MRTLRTSLDRVLAGGILALVISAPTIGFGAPDSIERAIPVPAPADVPPPSRRNIAPAGNVAAPDKTLAASDAQVIDQLRDMMTGNKLEKRIDRQPEHKAIDAVYAAGDYAPLWIKDAMLTPKAVIVRLSSAAIDGLDAVDPAIFKLTFSSG